jgi:hypothetical protein
MHLMRVLELELNLFASQPDKCGSNAGNGKTLSKTSNPQLKRLMGLTLALTGKTNNIS